MNNSADTATQASITAALNDAFLAVRSASWRSSVTYRLSLGYGVEDIALQLKCHVGDVRFLVQAMRARDKLAELYGLAGA